MSEELKLEERKEVKEVDAKKQADIEENDNRWREKFKQSKAELEQEREKSSEEIKKFEEKISNAYKAVEKRVIDAELKAVVIAAGLQDLDFIKLIDVSAIKLSEDGSVLGLEKAVNDFKAAKPALFTAERKSSSSKNEKLPNGDDKVASVDAFKMSDEEYRNMKAEKFGTY